ncbi:7905_t:CDS:2 [Entrophospora sp. SA101]|nr:7905_t:CDS:2 [Entrophospora sp. SA101]
MVHRRRSITAHNHRSQARNNINSHINRLNSSQYVYRFLQGNNPNSLIYVERTWGNYRKYPKTKSLWKHEDIAAQIGSYIRSNKLDITPKKLCDTLLPENENKRISEKTARRWLKGLGWKFGTYKKGLYNDGHERPDVVEYRNKFLKFMKEEYEAYAPVFEGDNFGE